MKMYIFIIDFQLLKLQYFSVFLQQSPASHSDIYNTRVITYFSHTTKEGSVMQSKREYSLASDRKWRAS